MTLYSQLEALPDDPILKITPLFRADSRPERVNVGIGVYQDEEGRPFVFEAVRRAEALICEQHLNKEYLPIGGDPLFCEKGVELLMGEEGLLQRGRLLAIQSIGASGALRVIGEFVVRHLAGEVSLPLPTWPNHIGLLSGAGLRLSSYPYCRGGVGAIDWQELYTSLQKLPPRTAVLFHACCHNPSGCDPTPEQWRLLCRLCRNHSLLPIFDIAYQGLGEDLDSDAYPIRLFYHEGIEMFVAVSFSKNFGLYGERIGLLLATVADSGVAAPVMSHLKRIVRTLYSMPPLHGARIIRTILTTPALKQLWHEELSIVRRRITSMRRALYDALTARSSGVDYSALATGHGLFTLTGLSSEQVIRLRHDHALYLTEDGRLNLAGLNHHNVERVADLLHPQSPYSYS